jgi:flavin reductase (DIM6/NTAB) family NADH-FMN oxidoreductase RutF
MKRSPIQVKDLVAPPIDLWEDGWLLLTAGDFERGDFNTMTVSWGGLGVLWHKAFAHVVVRPTRFTFEFIERYPTFTLCAFEERFRPALNILGTRSGRDGDKIAVAGLTPVASQSVDAPSFEEATLVIECRKLYWQDIDPARFLDPAIEKNYPSKDYHRSYFGEILAVQGVDAFRRGG